jgi:hypothetical protein
LNVRHEPGRRVPALGCGGNLLGLEPVLAQSWSRLVSLLHQVGPELFVAVLQFPSAEGTMSFQLLAHRVNFNSLLATTNHLGCVAFVGFGKLNGFACRAQRAFLGHTWPH